MVKTLFGLEGQKFAEDVAIRLIADHTDNFANSYTVDVTPETTDLASRPMVKVCIQRLMLAIYVLLNIESKECYDTVEELIKEINKNIDRVNCNTSEVSISEIPGGSSTTEQIWQFKILSKELHDKVIKEITVSM